MKKEKHGETALIMGNGPSVKELDFDELILNSSVVTFATNRISLIYDQTAWRPDFYTCFTMLSKTDKNWKKSIEKVVVNEETKCFLLPECKRWLGERKNVVYVQPYEHYRHSPIPDDLFKTPVSKKFLKSYSATTSIIQLSLSLGFKRMYIIGQDGYQEQIEDNHFSSLYGHDPRDFQKTNKRLIDMHRVLKNHCDKHGIEVKNLSNNSVLKMYEKSDILLKKEYKHSG